MSKYLYITRPSSTEPSTTSTFHPNPQYQVTKPQIPTLAPLPPLPTPNPILPPKLPNLPLQIRPHEKPHQTHDPSDDRINHHILPRTAPQHPRPQQPHQPLRRDHELPLLQAPDRGERHLLLRLHGVIFLQDARDRVLDFVLLLEARREDGAGEDDVDLDVAVRDPGGVGRGGGRRKLGVRGLPPRPVVQVHFAAQGVGQVAHGRFAGRVGGVAC